ncbi:AI-2E family transporter [Alphaproteobacteria bacterium]|nr:AI-2E family transporter [Alphaproteobacteria bacterium]
MPSDDLKRRLNPPLLTIGAAFLILTIVVAALAMGRPFLLPLVLALVVWYVIASLRDFMANIRLGGFQLPRWVSLLLSMLVIGSIAYFVINIVLASFAALVGDFPKYVSDANRLLELVQGLLPEGLTLDINLQNQFDRILGIANNFAGQLRLVTQNIVIIVIYVAFMLVEDQRFNAKLKHLFPNRDDYARAQQVLGAIGKKIQAYLAVKTLMSLITAVLAYIILLVFDINYAPVWAMLVFFLNFIPVVGSIIAVILPMAMAVLQFWEISPWVIFVVTGLLIGVQQFVGSFLEPRFLGSSLNLSPLIILVSLSFWGFLWGPVGMLISVPVTVMMAIIFASVPATRWIAVLLSQNGDSVQEEFGPVVMPTTGRTTDPS